jgi:hypothetical protein
MFPANIAALTSIDERLPRPDRRPHAGEAEIRFRVRRLSRAGA